MLIYSHVILTFKGTTSNYYIGVLDKLAIVCYVNTGTSS